MFYPRSILPHLEKEIETREANVLTGMRQTGKTTLLNHLFEITPHQNKLLLDLEDPLNRKIFEEESLPAIWANLAPFGINKNDRAFLFLDEIQNLPIISKVVKYFFDHFQTKFFLSGSSSFYLKNLFPESLTGRKIVFELFPLTFGEFLVFKEQDRTKETSFQSKEKDKNEIRWKILSPYLAEYLEYGGLPGVVLETDFERKKKLLREIFTSYFEKDVKSLGDFGNIEKLRNFILLLAERIGGQLEISSLSRELGVSRETIYSYLSFLEKTYFISLIPKFPRSPRRQSAGNKKLYFGDAGLANILGRLSAGQLFEQSVFQCLRPAHEINYYHQGSVERDFILDGKMALEVKEHADRHDVSLTKKVVRKLGIRETYVVSKAFTNAAGTISATDLP